MRRRVAQSKQPLRRVTPGTGTLVGVRLQPDLLNALDLWVDLQPLPLGRPEAIRQLIARALKNERL